MITLEHLYFQYNQKVIFTDAKMEIPDTGLTIVTGESGSGKSTLLRIISKQLTVADNVFIKDFSENKIIYVDQYATLDFDLTITEIFQFYSVLFEIEYNNEIMNDYLSIVHLQYLNNHDTIRHLSVGERKRLAVALAIYAKPKLILLDEPTSSLDLKTKTDLMKLIYETSQKTPFLIATHDIEDIDEYDFHYEIIDNKILKGRGFDEKPFTK